MLCNVNQKTNINEKKKIEKFNSSNENKNRCHRSHKI